MQSWRPRPGQLRRGEHFWDSFDESWLNCKPSWLPIAPERRLPILATSSLLSTKAWRWTSVRLRPRCRRAHRRLRSSSREAGRGSLQQRLPPQSAVTGQAARTEDGKPTRSLRPRSSWNRPGCQGRSRKQTLRTRPWSTPVSPAISRQRQSPYKRPRVGASS